MSKTLREFITETYHKSIETPEWGIINIYKNPTKSEFLTCMDEEPHSSKSLKGLLSADGETLYVFKPEYLEHIKVKARLQIKESPFIPIYVDIMKKTVKISMWNLRASFHRWLLSGEDYMVEERIRASGPIKYLMGGSVFKVDQE